jgi:hypothetical protein
MSPKQMILNGYTQQPDGTWHKAETFSGNVTIIRRDCFGRAIGSIYGSDKRVAALDGSKVSLTDQELQLFQLALRDMIAERDWPRVAKVADQLAHRARQLAGYSTAVPKRFAKRMPDRGVPLD